MIINKPPAQRWRGYFQMLNSNPTNMPVKTKPALPVQSALPEALAKAKKVPAGAMKADVLVIGAGPTGLACAIEAQKIGARVVVVDKGCIVNSLYHYPPHMVFFTTPELLEIGNIPFTTARQKPTREEALEYYRNVARHYRLKVCQYERVTSVTGSDNEFLVRSVDAHGQEHAYKVRKVIISTGYYDLPNMMNIPGEDLPKVFHYYRESHPYYDTDVLVIGGKNSAALAALDLWRHGARVTMVHRNAHLHANIKYWILPDIENRIKAGEINAYFESSVTEIGPDTVTLATPKGAVELQNDFVFALTGYHPDFEFLESMGIELLGEQKRPACDPQSLETNVAGIYIAGVVLSGVRTSEIFIENGRFHGQHIAQDLQKKLRLPSQN
jgi:thioredoxin reductase (NADPH)